MIIALISMKLGSEMIVCKGLVEVERRNREKWKEVSLIQFFSYSRLKTNESRRKYSSKKFIKSTSSAQPWYPLQMTLEWYILSWDLGQTEKSAIGQRHREETKAIRHQKCVVNHHRKIFQTETFNNK